MSTLRSLAELGEGLAATKKKLEQHALIGAYLKGLSRCAMQRARSPGEKLETTRGVVSTKCVRSLWASAR